MWSWPDGKCSIVNSTMVGASKLYRYPKGFSPGDVVHRTSKIVTSFKSETTMDRIIFEIFPFAMGILIVLLLMSTICYLCFSILRLFYLDTLKPYKLKKLRGLGKHRHYFSTGDDEEKKRFRKLRPTINTLDLEEYETHMGRNFPSKMSKDLLLHPPGKKISYTSPPLNAMEDKGATARGFPHVMDLLAAGDLDQVSKFPSGASKMYAGGFGAPSRIPRPIDEIKRVPWTWKRDKLAEEETGKDLERIRSARSQLAVKSTQKFTPLSTETTETLPEEKKVLPEENPPTTYRSEVPPQIEKTDLPPEHPVTSTSITTSITVPKKMFTGIPKPGKKMYKQQLMILRGGPRRESEEIRKLIRSMKGENTFGKH